MKKQSTLKRALALGMSATMVGATLAGCGGSASSTAATSTETASSAATEAEASCLYTQIPESRINTELFNYHQKTE